MRQFTNFIAGALCGALVGSVAALLLTPASGEELKRRAQIEFAGLTDEMRLAYQSRRSQLEAELEALRNPEVEKV